MVCVIFTLILIGAGCIADKVFSAISHSKTGNNINTALSFALLIFITNTIGMHFLKDMIYFAKLQLYLDTVVYAIKYAFLSIAVGVVLGIISGLIRKLVCRHKH